MGFLAHDHQRVQDSEDTASTSEGRSPIARGVSSAGAGILRLR